jgi:Na+/H+-translocating membrane pyrophosphatase
MDSIMTTKDTTIILGIAGIIFAVLIPPVGLLLSILAWRQLKGHKFRRFAMYGIIMSCFMLLVVGGILTLALTQM